MLGRRVDGLGWAVAGGKVELGDGIPKFAALRELKEEFGMVIPQTPEYLLRVEHKFENFVPYNKVHRDGKVEKVLALSDVYVFKFKDDERLVDFLQAERDGEMVELSWFALSDVINYADEIFLPTLVTLNKVYENSKRFSIDELYKESAK